MQYPDFFDAVPRLRIRDPLAEFLGVEAVLLFSSGGSANAGALTTLVGAGDLIISDRLNHASIIDGCRLSRADVVSYDNRNVEALRAALEKAPASRKKLIVSDGVFSMEGGAAPLAEIYALARQYDALLVVDEAHALGVVGENGVGSLSFRGLRNDSEGVVLTGSLSKAMGGASGGYVAGPRAIIDKLRAQCRSFIFTQGMTTANAASALAAVKICRGDPTLRTLLWKNCDRLRAALRARDIPMLDSDSAITAVVVGDEDRVRRASVDLLARGVYAPAIAFPVVARGEARLRLQVSAAHQAADLDHAAKAVADALEAQR